MKQERLGLLATGQPVLDRPNSHMHQGVREVIGVALWRIGVTPRERSDMIIREISFSGEFSGFSHCVETDETDRIVYAIRPRRSCYTRFVMNREPIATNIMTIVLMPEEILDRYILVTAYWGEHTPREIKPGEIDHQARQFWANHALIWGLEPACTAPIPAKRWCRTPFFSAPLTER